MGASLHLALAFSLKGCYINQQLHQRANYSFIYLQDLGGSKPGLATALPVNQACLHELDTDALCCPEGSRQAQYATGIGVSSCTLTIGHHHTHTHTSRMLTNLSLSHNRTGLPALKPTQDPRALTLDKCRFSHITNSCHHWTQVLHRHMHPHPMYLQKV